MEFTVLINQVRALEWGLNSQQAMLFAFLFNSAAWAEAVDLNGVAYWHVSKNKVIQELPLLTDKPDTVYRLMKQLESAGLIRFSFSGKKTLISITDKGAKWNSSRGRESDIGKKSEKQVREVDVGKKSVVMSEKNPSDVGKKSAQTSENFPTDHITNNQITKSLLQQQVSDWSPPDYVFDQLAQHCIPDEFSRDERILIEFRSYWMCRQDVRLNLLPNKFLKSVIRLWRKHEPTTAATTTDNNNGQQQRTAKHAVLAALENRGDTSWLG